MAKTVKTIARVIVPITKRFSIIGETKGALRYSELTASGEPFKVPSDPGVVVGTLYLRKSALHGKTPKTLSVTIREE